jgi:uncharacterized protein YndB with AHSA1/START domain
MAQPFEIVKEIEVAASPEAVWEAIATGAGIDGWFLGTGNEVEPRLGGRVRIDFGGGGAGMSTVTAWEPPHRFAHRGDEAPDGSLHAFEFTVEARAGGRAVVRMVHSGFLAGDWDTEYDSVSEGDFMYLHQLGQYVTYFHGRRAAAVSLWRTDEADRDRTLAALRAALGLGDSVDEGDQVAVDIEGVGRIQGVVDFVSRNIFGIRTDDALYRFMWTPQRVAFIGHHIYREPLDEAATTAAWQVWLDRSLA